MDMPLLLRSDRGLRFAPREWPVEGSASRCVAHTNALLNLTMPLWISASRRSSLAAAALGLAGSRLVPDTGAASVKEVRAAPRQDYTKRLLAAILRGYRAAA